MAAYLYSGIKSLKLVLDRPYDTIRTTDVRDDLTSVKVWYSATSGFTPETQGILVPSGNSLSVDITGLTPNTTYYVRYAFISAIDPEVYTISTQLSQTVLEENISVYGYLTNDPTPIVTETDGSGGSFASATGVFKVFNLSTEVTGAGPVYSIKADSTTGITTPVINATTGVYSCSGLTQDVGTVIFKAVYNGVTIEQVWNVYRAKAGQTAPLLQLSATTTEFVYKDPAATSALTPQTVITARLVNLTGTPTFTAVGFTRDGTSLGTIDFTQTNNVITITKAHFDAHGVTIGNVRVTATLGSATDVITIYRINDGTEQITVELSNEAHVIPADSSGNTVTANYVGSGTTIRVKQGNTYLLVDNVADPATGLFDVGSWRVTTITSVGITCDTTPGVYSNYIEYDQHSAMTANVATISYTITGTSTSGTPFSIIKVQSFSKTTDGVNGTSPLIYSINPSAPVITKQAKDFSTAGVHSSITIQGKRYNGITTTNYGWVTVTSNLGNEAATPTDTASTPYTLSPADNAGVTFYTVKLYKESTISLANLVDTQVIYVLFKGASGVDGAPAISAILGNETHIFPAAFDGTISAPSYAGSGTTIRVYEGAQELVYTGSGTSILASEPGTWKLWVFEQGGFNNISIGTFNDSGDYATVGDHSGVAAGVDTSRITYNIYGRNSLGTQFNITKTQTFSKSKTGAGGTNARSVDLTTVTQAFAYTETGTTASPANTIVTATANNTTPGSTVFYEFLIGTTSKQNTSSNQYTYTPTTTYASMPEQVTVKIRETANNVAVLATDTMTMIGIKPGAAGANAISGLLTNESAVVSTNSDGSGGVYTAAGVGGTFLVFDGVTPKTGNGPAYSVVLAETTAGLTVGINATSGVYTASLDNTTDSGSAKFRAVYGGVTIDKVYNIAKSKPGAAGSSATSYWLTVSSGALQKTKAGVITPSSIIVAAYSATGTAAPVAYAGRFIIYENGSATPVYTSAGNESSKSYSLSGNSVTSVKVELYLAGGTTNKIDEQIVPVLVDGSDTVTAILSNESVTLPASADGTVLSFTGASTTMSVFIGATDDSANWTYAAVVQPGTPAPITSSNLVTSRTQTVSALTVASSFIDITASKTGYPSITKRFSVNRSLNGAKGDTGEGTTQIYIRSASQPTTPAASAGTPSSWFATVAGATGTDPLWTSFGTRAVNATTYTWQTPVRVEGAKGDSANPLKNATGYLYYDTASVNAPAAPTASAYNFSTGEFGTVTAGWSTTISVAPASTTEKMWAVRYSVQETVAGGAQTVTISSVFTHQNFNGLVTFTNNTYVTPTGATTAANNAIAGSTVIANKVDAAGATSAANTAIANSSVIAGKANATDVFVANTTIIDGGKISTGSIDVNRLSVGPFSSAGVARTGERVVITQSKIEVYDAAGTRRVVLGDLS